MMLSPTGRVYVQSIRPRFSVSWTRYQNMSMTWTYPARPDAAIDANLQELGYDA
jgi:hypothetical protein